MQTREFLFSGFLAEIYKGVWASGPPSA